jgi:tetratricopeptide (TPR) repeat protein
MSVLYKALQKAAKDNEQRQASQEGGGFDPARLADSGVIRVGGSRGKWRIASLVFLLIAMAAMGAAYYVTSTVPGTAPAPGAPQPAVVALAPPGAPHPAPANTPAPNAPAPAAQAPIAAAPAAPPAPQVAAANPPTPAVPPAAAAAQQQAAAAPEAAAPAAEPKVEARAPEAVAPKPAPKVVAAREPMPKLDPDSPARMLDPPINIHRSQIDLEGVGPAVQVRTVSQAAQDTVGTAYSALVRGEYDTALGFYQKALKEEPHSVLALLGRGTALQKLGRKDEARSSYEQALKFDPENREALSNLTALEGERTPGDALRRLMDLEHDYPNFSPIKAQIGMVYARMEDFDGALDYLRRALTIAPDAALYQYNIALVLDRMGRRDEAVFAYDRTLSLMSGGHGIPEISVPDIQRRLSYLRAL